MPIEFVVTPIRYISRKGQARCAKCNRFRPMSDGEDHDEICMSCGHSASVDLEDELGQILSDEIAADVDRRAIADLAGGLAPEVRVEKFGIDPTSLPTHWAKRSPLLSTMSPLEQYMLVQWERESAIEKIQRQAAHAQISFPYRPITFLDPLSFEDEPTHPEHPYAERCREVDEMQNQMNDDHRWPHKNGCPLCGSDAYVGFDSVECSNGSCSNCPSR